LANEADVDAEDGWRPEPDVAMEDDVRCELVWTEGLNELDALAPWDVP
jgi:hypothetical protein